MPEKQKLQSSILVHTVHFFTVILCLEKIKLGRIILTSSGKGYTVKYCVCVCVCVRAHVHACAHGHSAVSDSLLPHGRDT